MTLAEHLPDDSALAAAMAGGPEHRGWTLQARILASVFNAIRFADTNNVRVNGGKSSAPTPLEPPKTAKKRRRLDLSAHPRAQKIQLPKG